MTPMTNAQCIRAAVNEAVRLTLKSFSGSETELKEIETFRQTLHKSWQFSLLLTEESTNELKKIIDNNTIIRCFVLAFLDRFYIELAERIPKDASKALCDEIATFVQLHNEIREFVIDLRIKEACKYNEAFVISNSFAYLLMLSVHDLTPLEL